MTPYSSLSMPFDNPHSSKLKKHKRIDMLGNAAQDEPFNRQNKLLEKEV
jgi:hypothetical protein